MNQHTHEVRALSSLTEQERAEWIAEDAATKARLEALFPERQTMQDAVEAQRDLDRRFAQRPTIPGAPGAERRGGFDALGRPRH